MRITVILTFICNFLFYSIVSNAQKTGEEDLDSLSGMVVKNLRANKIENIFLVTNKYVYSGGEALWFRAFVLDAMTQKVSNNDKNLFVELIDENDHVVNRMLLNARTQQLNGRIYLNDSLHSGNYYLVAYNNNILKEHPQKIHAAPLYIISSRSSANQDHSSKTLNKGLDLSFFPEGGAIITGATTTIAYRITNDNDPVQATGYVKDSRDSIIARFTSDRFGIGKFDIYASRFRKYKAYVNWQGKEFPFLLPQFNLRSAQISIATVGHSKKMRVLLEDSLYKPDFITYIIGISKDSIFYASMGKGMYEAYITDNDIPQGISTIYLFDRNYKLLSQRKLYSTINGVQVQASTDRKLYEKRDKVTLNISVKDQKDKPLLSSISVLVSDSALIPDLDDDILLHSLNGSNEYDAELNWYMLQDDHLNDDERDLFMLTQKNSGDLLRFPENTFHENDSLLYIKGRIKLNNNDLQPAKTVFLLDHSSGRVIEMGSADKHGRFSFPLTEYPDSTSFYIKVASQNSSVNRDSIEMYPFVFPDVIVSDKDLPKISPLITKTEYSDKYIDTIKARGVLKEVIVTSTKKILSDQDQAKRVSPFSKIISADLLMDRHAGTIVNALMMIPGIRLQGGYLTIEGASGMSVTSADEPLILVDGVTYSPSADNNTSPAISLLNGISVSDVEFIEILTSNDAGIFGMKGAHGAILINTKNHVNTINTEVPDTKPYIARGYHQAPPFLYPDYDNKQIRNAIVADKRSALYFAGNKITDTNGTLKLSFFTSDLHSTCKIIIRGVTSKGDLFYKTLSFQTK